MRNLLRPAIVSFCCLTVVTGVLYPLVITGIAVFLFPDESTGSLIRYEGKVVGSSLIAQPFSNAKYFWPRPSAANYDGAASSGSNLAPTNPVLAETIASRIQGLRASDPQFRSSVPVDLVTTSGSGLDPHISLVAAEAQAGRIATARNMSSKDVQRLIDEHTEHRTGGVLGEPRVNVLRINLALDHYSDKADITANDDHLGYRWRGFAHDLK